jgi:hypothetical protein
VRDNPDEITRITLRMLKELHDTVTEEAKANKRSLNAEILVLIEDGLKYRRGDKTPKEGRREGLNQAAA